MLTTVVLAAPMIGYADKSKPADTGWPAERPGTNEQQQQEKACNQIAASLFVEVSSSPQGG
jgi:hypothetical protein